MKCTSFRLWRVFILDVQLNEARCGAATLQFQHRKSHARHLIKEKKEKAFPLVRYIRELINLGNYYCPLSYPSRRVGPASFPSAADGMGLTGFHNEAPWLNLP